MASKRDGSTKRLAEKLLERLPPVDKKRRSLYRNQFTELQCRDWGNRTSSGAVLADAERTIGKANGVLMKHAVPGYPLFRSGWRGCAS